MAHAEEARRVALRHLEQEASIDALTEEVTTWRSRALAAEAQLQRMIDREQQLISMLDESRAASLRKQDHYNETFAVVRTQFAAVSRLLLDGFEAINAVTGPSRARVDVDAIAETLQKDDPSVVPQDHPMPSVVNQGPLPD